MDRSKKMARAKAITPKGFRDNFHSYLKRRDQVLEVVNRVYELYGFERLETPAIETVDALGKFRMAVMAWEKILVQTPLTRLFWMLKRLQKELCRRWALVKVIRVTP